MPEERGARPVGEPLLEVADLAVRFESSAGMVDAVQGISFAVNRGETLGLVGESGSGKTVTALAILNLVPPPGRIASGRVTFDGRDLLTLPAEEMRRRRGREIGFIFQEPLSSLNPVFTCGDQVAESLRVHLRMSRAAARDRAVELLQRVGIPDPARRARDYPHQLSGGLRQRAMIAMALALGPKLLIADEPTTALDVTIQAQILDLLRRLREEEGLTLLLITHNLGVVESLADRISVMQAGRLVESGPAGRILDAPAHPYTQALLKAVPRLTARRADPGRGAASGAPLLEISGLSVSFPAGGRLAGGGRRRLTAVRDLSLAIGPGETVGLVGESGCGKTTLARAVVRLIRPDRGHIRLAGAELTSLSGRALRAQRRNVQMVFQDPAGSLNPRLTIEQQLTEPLEVHRLAGGAAARRRAAELLESVGLLPEQARRYPHEFSGGQRQRIGIARALALGPSLLVLDEPVSALDVSIQAQILALLAGLRRERNLAYLFVAHDLAVVRHLSDRVAVMYLGELVELAAVDTIYGDPLHPYTKALLAAVPARSAGRAASGGPRLLLPGEPPSPLNPPSGCVFHPRCSLAQPACRASHPALSEVRPGHWLRCPVAAAAVGD